MAKLTDPSTISSAFHIDKTKLDGLGVVDVMLCADTLLFIDPLLLSESSHPEIVKSVESYNSKIGEIIRLLSASKQKGDPAWKAAAKKFDFPEVRWTCLGYGGASTFGSGFGKELKEKTLSTITEIIKLDIDDPDLLMAMSIFEEGIGPDRISDMTANLILDELVEFTLRVNKDLKLKTKEFVLNRKTYTTVINPKSNDALIFVPKDIVRALPVAKDMSELSAVIKESEELKDKVNLSIGKIWGQITRHEKAAAKERALASKKSFLILLEMLHDAKGLPYDFCKDKEGEVFWQQYAFAVHDEYPLDLSAYGKKKLSEEAVFEVVMKIVEQYKNLIELNGLWKEMWADDGNCRKEAAAQRLFFAVAYSYCMANDLDLNPEADLGNGPVDFKISQGAKSKVLVEMKLSRNAQLVHGYEKQLKIYQDADRTDKGIFVVLDVGNLGKKLDRVKEIKAAQLAAQLPASEIILIDASKRDSASIRR